MATIRIAEDPHPKDGIVRINTQEGAGPATEGSIYRTRLAVRSELGETHDDIYNIRSRSRARSNSTRRASGIFTPDREDDDPGLRNADDYKQKQVCASTRWLVRGSFC
jgi:KUP system potassium uptake protein